MSYFIGIDVGTGSARAGVFDENGWLVSDSSEAITLYRPQVGRAEQSSAQIWKAICIAIQRALSASSVAPRTVKALSFSATCSLVLVGKQGSPVSLSHTENDTDVVVWMDQRAVDEAQEVNRTGHYVLESLGGQISPEMQVPKMMWLKRNRPELWEQLDYAGDLADYLTYRCTGRAERSICTLVCKWTYDGEKDGWHEDFLSTVGLSDLLSVANLPDKALKVGESIGYLTQQAADDLGLTTGTLVTAGLIDAHAGALGTVGTKSSNVEQYLALIAGTSNCHLIMAKTAHPTPGVWGPYKHAIFPDYYLTEGGQSTTGAALDHVVNLFGIDDKLDESPHLVAGDLIYQRLIDDIYFGSDVQVIPDFLGNRSPIASPELRAMISGLTIEDPFETFLKVYFATAKGIAYGTRMVIEQINHCGGDVQTIFLSGGHKKSPLLTELYADVTGCRVVVSGCEEPVLLGAAISAMTPFEQTKDLIKTAASVGQICGVYLPCPSRAEAYERGYRSFLKHYEQATGAE
ncbi:FGGY family pentulose kinase [Aliiglaciecola sp.]|nr:FGGY family pentulose kinase [Aliiglaciecola sp.]